VECRAMSHVGRPWAWRFIVWETRAFRRKRSWVCSLGPSGGSGLGQSHTNHTNVMSSDIFRARSHGLLGEEIARLSA